MLARHGDNYESITNYELKEGERTNCPSNQRGVRSSKN
jgi:hypothetical protein